MAIKKNKQELLADPMDWIPEGLLKEVINIQTPGDCFPVGF